MEHLHQIRPIFVDKENGTHYREGTKQEKAAILKKVNAFDELMEFVGHLANGSTRAVVEDAKKLLQKYGGELTPGEKGEKAAARENWEAKFSN